MTIQGFPHPPIIEAVCGVIFKPLEMDLLDFGLYWSQRRKDYPHRELHPPIIGSGRFSMGLGAMRLWMLSEQKDVIIQIQSDRFYVNWKRVDDRYPSYQDKLPYGVRGLRTIFEEEFNMFEDFCNSHAEVRPVVERVEITKIDLIQDEEAIRGLKPLQWEIERTGGALGQFNIQTSAEVEAESQSLLLRGSAREAHLETRILCAPLPTVMEGLDEANKRANDLFLEVWPLQIVEEIDSV